MIANSHPKDTTAIVLMHCSLPNEYVMTFPMALPCGRRKTSCEHYDADTTRRSDAGGTAPNETTRETHTYDFNVWNISDVGHVCGRRHLSKRT